MVESTPNKTSPTPQVKGVTKDLFTPHRQNIYSNSRFIVNPVLKSQQNEFPSHGSVLFASNQNKRKLFAEEFLDNSKEDSRQESYQERNKKAAREYRKRKKEQNQAKDKADQVKIKLLEKDIEDKKTLCDTLIHSIDVGIENHVKQTFNFENKEILQSQIRDFVGDYVLKLTVGVNDSENEVKNKYIFKKLNELAPEECKNTITSLFKEAEEHAKQEVERMNEFAELYVNKVFNTRENKKLQSEITVFLYNYKKNRVINSDPENTMAYSKYVIPKLKEKFPDVYREAEQKANERLFKEISSTT